MSALFGRHHPTPHPPTLTASLDDSALAALAADLHQIHRELLACPPSIARTTGLDLAQRHAQLLRLLARR